MIEELNSIKSSRKDLKILVLQLVLSYMMIGVFFVREKDSFVYFFSTGSILIALGGITPVALNHCKI